MTCNHEKREHINYCGDCGADLTLREDEIKARDKFFGIYKELLKEKNPDIKFDRGMFDVFISICLALEVNDSDVQKLNSCKLA